MSRSQPAKPGPITNDAPSGNGLSTSAVVYPEISAQQQRRDDALVDFQQRRVARRLEELERTNPTDIPASSFTPQQTTPASSIPGMPAGLLVAQPTKKKQTPNVRKILYAKKNLRDWLEELPSNPAPPYTLASSPAPSSAKARKICSSCGYIAAYRCPRCAEWSCDMVCMKVHARDGGCGVGM